VASRKKKGAGLKTKKTVEKKKNKYTKKYEVRLVFAESEGGHARELENRHCNSGMLKDGVDPFVGLETGGQGRSRSWVKGKA